MPINVPSNSRYKNSTPVVTTDGQETFGRMKTFDFLTTDKFTKMQVSAQYAHRPDLIADNYYGSPSFYWVVIMFNRPRNPFMWPKNGEVIKLPDINMVIREL